LLASQRLIHAASFKNKVASESSLFAGKSLHAEAETLLASPQSDQEPDAKTVMDSDLVNSHFPFLFCLSQSIKEHDVHH
jgi:hypothetical protein